MPRSVNQKRRQTSYGQGKIVCKHNLMLIQNRLKGADVTVMAAGPGRPLAGNARVLAGLRRRPSPIPDPDSALSQTDT